MQPLRADYILRVQIHAYSNPTNRCAGCGAVQGCCDNPEVFECTNNRKCDNEFFFCVRPLGTARQTLDILLASVPINMTEQRGTYLQCLQPPPALTSSINTDGLPIDYSSAIFLGLPNPLEFRVNASVWEVSVYNNDETESRDLNAHGCTIWTK